MTKKNNKQSSKPKAPAKNAKEVVNKEVIRPDSHDAELTRMFKNPFLEKLTHVHPSTPFIIYIPVILTSAYIALAKNWYNMNIVDFLFTYVCAMAFWTITEYCIHRFVFHPPFSDTYLRWLYFYTHGIHHEFPNDTTRLVMPPLTSLPLAVIFYFSFRAVLGDYHMAFFAGFVTGYLIYDFLHYATHYYNFSPAWFRRLRKHHLVHHFNDAARNYGVSNSFWDSVFRTRYKDLNN